jgi:hypothetical protein
MRLYIAFFSLFNYIFYLCQWKYFYKGKGEAIPVTGRGGPHFLDNRLTDGGDVVSLTRRTFFNSRKIAGTITINPII